MSFTINMKITAEMCLHFVEDIMEGRGRYGGRRTDDDGLIPNF